jgi:hypothetical protein
MFGMVPVPQKKRILRSDSGPVLGKEIQVSVLVPILEIRFDFGSISE